MAACNVKPGFPLCPAGIAPAGSLRPLRGCTAPLPQKCIAKAQRGSSGSFGLSHEDGGWSMSFVYSQFIRLPCEVKRNVGAYDIISQCQLPFWNHIGCVQVHKGACGNQGTRCRVHACQQSCYSRRLLLACYAQRTCTSGCVQQQPVCHLCERTSA